MCQNPKCVKKLTKIARKCGKNVSKFKMYLNSDKNNFINVVKIWQKPQIWQFFVTFYMRKWNIFWNILRQKLTKLWQNGLFVTFLVPFGEHKWNISTKYVTKMCQNHSFWQFFVTILSFKGHTVNSKATKGRQCLKKMSILWHFCQFFAKTLLRW